MDNHAADIRQAVLGIEIDGNRFPEIMPMLMAREPDDIEALSAVRYLFHKRLWDGEAPQAGEVLNRFYSTGVSTMGPEEYRERTGLVIQTSYGYEMPEFQAYVPPERSEQPQRPSKPRKVKRPAVERHESDGSGGTRITDLTEGESGSRQFKSLAEHDVDTTGASDRLKKVIGIQRKG